MQRPTMRGEFRMMVDQSPAVACPAGPHASQTTTQPHWSASIETHGMPHGLEDGSVLWAAGLEDGSARRTGAVRRIQESKRLISSSRSGGIARRSLKRSARAPLAPGAFAVCDPDGRLAVFGLPRADLPEVRQAGSRANCRDACNTSSWLLIVFPRCCGSTRRTRDSWCQTMSSREATDE
jgi:hypothetical protein